MKGPTERQREVLGLLAAGHRLATDGAGRAFTASPSGFASRVHPAVFRALVDAGLVAADGPPQDGRQAWRAATPA